MNSAREHPARFRAPAPQKNLDRATQLAFEALAEQTDEQLQWLGAEPAGDAWRVPVLHQPVHVDRSAQRVTVADGTEVGPHWRILVLHYLAIRDRPEPRMPEVTFADLPTARSYNEVYRGRTIGRLCATVGRDESTLRAAGQTLGGHAVEAGDVAFDFDLFPRLAMRVVWYAADDEFPASATILLPGNIESLFCPEDIVVLSERLVSRLCGRPL